MSTALTNGQWRRARLRSGLRRTKFWGDRMGSLIDPFGHSWSLSTHIEYVSEEEMQKRMQAFSEQSVLKVKKPAGGDPAGLTCSLCGC